MTVTNEDIEYTDEYDEDEDWFDPCQSACGPDCPYFCSDCLE